MSGGREEMMARTAEAGCLRNYSGDDDVTVAHKLRALGVGKRHVLHAPKRRKRAYVQSNQASE